VAAGRGRIRAPRLGARGSAYVTHAVMAQGACLALLGDASINSSDA
jgi:hypothetical protein